MARPQPFWARRVWRRSVEITLPLLMPSIIAAALLVFLFCFTSFGVILILGGPRFATLEVETYRQAVNYFNLPLAAALALVQLGLTFIVMVVYTRLQARASLPLNLRPQSLTARRPTTWREWFVVAVVNTILVVVLLTPLIALVARSVTLGEGPPTLRYYQALTENRSQSIFFVRPVEAIRNSLLFSFAAVALSLLLGLIAAYLLAGSGRQQKRLVRWLDPVFLLPLGTSAVTLGLGYIIALDEPPLNLRASLVLIPLAYTLIAMPFVVRTLLPALRSLSPRLRESAAVMGASPGPGHPRGGPADHRPGGAGGRGLRLYDQPGRIRRHAAALPTEIPHHVGDHLPRAEPAWPAQLRPGAGHEYLADGCLSGRTADHRAVAGGRCGRVLMALLEVAHISKSFGDTPSAARCLVWRPTVARSSACWGRPAAARRRYCASSPGWSRSMHGQVRVRRP